MFYLLYWILSATLYLSMVFAIYCGIYGVLRHFGVIHSSLVPQKVSFYASIGAEVCIIGLCSLLAMLAFAPLVLLAGKTHTSRNDVLHWVMSRFGRRLVGLVLGLRIALLDRNGKPIPDDHPTQSYYKLLHESQPAIYLLNHQTHLDALILALLAPPNTAILMKKSLLFVPFLGLAAWMCGCVFIDRFKKDKALASLQVAGERIKSERLGVFVFPEGTRSKSESVELLPFKKGAFHLAVQTKCPLIPIVVRWYKKDIVNFERQICHFDAADLQIQILDPIQTTGKNAADIDSLIDESRSIMFKALKSLSSKKSE